MTTRKKKGWQDLPMFDTTGMASADELKVKELEEWWMTHSHDEAAKMLPKAIEYGSIDLDIMGQGMLAMMPQMEGVVPPQELAIAFYLLGKIARLFGAYEQGREPSDDTWEDIGIYAKMGQRVRVKGHWG